MFLKWVKNFVWFLNVEEKNCFALYLYFILKKKKKKTLNPLKKNYKYIWGIVHKFTHLSQQTNKITANPSIIKH